MSNPRLRIDLEKITHNARQTVEISRMHANFFINRDNAKASDYASLIELAQEKVLEKFGTRLELEIELIGDWAGL